MYQITAGKVSLRVVQLVVVPRVLWLEPRCVELSEEGGLHDNVLMSGECVRKRFRKRFFVLRNCVVVDRSIFQSEVLMNSFDVLWMMF